MQAGNRKTNSWRERGSRRAHISPQEKRLFIGQDIRQKEKRKMGPREDRKRLRPRYRSSPKPAVSLHWKKRKEGKGKGDHERRRVNDI